MTSVAIIYGFAEGEWQGGLMRPALEKAGFRLEKNPEAADVIIAHSGGCLLLPFSDKQQRIILIDPPYWPGKLMLKSLLGQLSTEPSLYFKNGQLKHYSKKLFWNTYYIFRHPIRNIKMYNPTRKDKLFEILPQQEITIIRNQKDPWCSPEAKNRAAENNIPFHELPGTHDDCWLHPAPYISLIKQS